MTQEEICRFALQLSEAARIRALMEQDAAAMDGIPSATGLLRESAPEVAPNGAEFKRSAVEHEMAWISDLAEEVRND